MKLLVGLGNPGAKYDDTRHNAGFMVVGRLAAEWSAPFKPEPRFKALVAEARLGGEKVVCMLPQTYMNLSGEAVAAYMRFAKLTPDDVLVVFDDVSIPLGTVRVRPDGSAGGQNGVKSLIALLGTQSFARVKVGVGPVPPKWDLVDFVLSKFRPAEREALELGLARGAEAAVTVLRAGVEAAAQAYNGLKPPETPLPS